MWIPLVFVAILGIFVIGCIVEYIRQHTLQHIVELKPIVVAENWLQQKYDDMMGEYDE